MSRVCMCPLCRCPCKAGCVKCRDWISGYKASIEEFAEFRQRGMIPPFTTPYHLLPGADEFAEMYDTNGLLPLNVVVIGERWGDE